MLSGVWIESAGAIGAITAFLIGGGIMLVIGLTYAELASALPFAGGASAASIFLGILVSPVEFEMVFSSSFVSVSA